MEKNKRAKILFQKYLNRTASEEDLEEMFKLFEDRRQFVSVYEEFEQEWESQDVSFDLEKLTLEQLRADFKLRQLRDHKSYEKDNQRRWIWRTSGVAAGLAVLIGMYIVFFSTPSAVIYLTGYGETKEIVLEDGSLVLLNANSRLEWSTDWEETGVRELELDGEAFFKVQRICSQQYLGAEGNGQNLPFWVVTPDLTVKVYGTAFNVVSRRQKTNVFLESGKVELELKKNPSENMRISSTEKECFTMIANTIVMEPGDAVSYSVANQYLEQVNNSTTQENASWTEGSLSFENERLEDVLHQIEDIYGKQFEVMDTALLNREVNLGLPYEDWTTVSGLMKLSLEIEMKQRDGKIILER